MGMVSRLGMRVIKGLKPFFRGRTACFSDLLIKTFTNADGIARRFPGGDEPPGKERKCTPMNLFSGLLSGDRVYVVLILFLLFCGLSLFFFSAGQPRSFLKGLWLTFVDFVVAPFAYIRYAVFRLSTESGQSVRLKATDPQFLLRTAIRIQLGVLFLSLSLIGALGLMLVLDRSVPPEVAASREQAAIRLNFLKSESLPRAQRELADLETKLKSRSRLEEELRQKRSAISELTAKIDSSASLLAAEDSGGHFASIDRFLEANRGRLMTPVGRDGIRDAVSRYLQQSPTEAEFDEKVFKHLDLVFQRAALRKEIDEAEAANRPEILQRAKTEAEGQLLDLRNEMKKLEKETSFLNLISSVSLGSIWEGMLILMAVVWAVLWIGGVSIESAEIFIDIATNLRRLRRASEGRPDGTVILPAQPEPMV